MGGGQKTKKKFRPIPLDMQGQPNQFPFIKTNDDYSQNKNSRDRNAYQPPSRRRNEGGSFGQNSRDGDEGGEDSASSNPWRGPSSNSSNWRRDEGDSGNSQQSSRGQWPARDSSNNSQWRSDDKGQNNQSQDSSRSGGFRSYSSRNQFPSREQSNNDSSSGWRSEPANSEKSEASTESSNVWRPRRNYGESSATYGKGTDNDNKPDPPSRQDYNREGGEKTDSHSDGDGPNLEENGEDEEYPDHSAPEQNKPPANLSKQWCDITDDDNKIFNASNSEPEPYKETESSSKNLSKTDSNQGHKNYNVGKKEENPRQRGFTDTNRSSTSQRDQNDNRYHAERNKKLPWSKHTDDSKNEYSKNGRNPGTRDSLENADKRGSAKKIFFSAKLTNEQEGFTEYMTSKDVTKFNKVREEEQDLFEVGNDYALAHCVAEDMNMGSGIAVEFRVRFKKLPELYAQNASTGGLAYLNCKDRFIYYLVTKKLSQGKPSYDSLWASLLKLRQEMREKKVTKLAMPRIGCGLDRLNWDIVKPMLEFLFQNEDVEILVCNHQPDGATAKVMKRCKIVEDPKPVTEIAPETIIIYFASKDGRPTESMKVLDEKFKFLADFQKIPKALGDTVRYVPNFNKNYILYGCIVKNNQDDLFSFVDFASCLHKITKNYKMDNFYYIAFQALEDDLLNSKILNLMKYTLKEMDIYICGRSETPLEQ